MELYDHIAHSLERNAYSEVNLDLLREVRVFANVNDNMIVRDTVGALEQQGYVLQ